MTNINRIKKEFLMNPSPLPMAASPIPTRSTPSFQEVLDLHHEFPLLAKSIHTLQVNVGKVCNQTCHHCHVDAGPHRTEQMTKATMDQILAVLDGAPQISTVDITGGAPEMNPHFEYLLEECRNRNRHVIDRCNLTVFFVKGKEHLPQFLADHQVEIIASLPCYQESNVDQQRGKGVFERSLRALKILNQLGYGKAGSPLILNLVFNPLGPKLPPDQSELEQSYKEKLAEEFGIQFNQLFTITNMPISRFLQDLEETDCLESYYDLLVRNFNRPTLEGVMCRSLINIGWDGRLYDCDFNQMLDLPLKGKAALTVEDFDLFSLSQRSITVGSHCFGCTAGSGSSCGGSITDTA